MKPTNLILARIYKTPTVRNWDDIAKNLVLRKNETTSRMNEHVKVDSFITQFIYSSFFLIKPQSHEVLKVVGYFQVEFNVR